MVRLPGLKDNLSRILDRHGLRLSCHWLRPRTRAKIIATDRGRPPWPPLRSSLTMRSWDDFRPSASKMGFGPMIDSTVAQDVSGRTGLGVAWLLVLAGPLGWIGLLIIAATRQNSDVLTVTLPYSEGAHLRLRRAQRARSQAMWVAIAGFAAAFVSLLFRTTDSKLLALAVAIVVVGALVKSIMETHASTEPLFGCHSMHPVDGSPCGASTPDFVAAMRRDGRQFSPAPLG